jgi:hypothetical protein
MIGETERKRHELQSLLVAALVADFEAFGCEAVKRLREKDPGAYLRAVAAAATDAQPGDTTWSELSDAELSAAIAVLREAAGARVNDAGGAG